MTAKRFIIKNERTVCDGFYGKCFVCSWKSDAEEMCRLLNELHDKYIDEYALRETLQQELQRVEEENKTLKTRFKEERELAIRLSRECDALTVTKQELELEIIRLETIIRTGDVE